jgi:hypothetical protein
MKHVKKREDSDLPPSSRYIAVARLSTSLLFNLKCFCFPLRFLCAFAPLRLCGEGLVRLCDFAVHRFLEKAW